MAQRWLGLNGSFEKGGLDVGGLKAFNLALILKWRWRFATEFDAPWVQLIKAIHGELGGLDGGRTTHSSSGVWGRIVDAVLKLASNNIIPFDSMTMRLGDGLRIKFWKDVWNGVDFMWSWSRTVVRGRVAGQIQNLILLVQQVHKVAGPDRLWWMIGDTGEYTVKATRDVIDDLTLPNAAVSTRWCKEVPKKVNIFIWRLMWDRIPTRLNLSKRGLEIDSLACPSCGGGVESIEHTFFRCGLALDVWKVVERWCDLEFPEMLSIKEWLSWVDDLRMSSSRRKRLEIIVLTTCWMLWRVRNSVVFDSVPIRRSSIFDNIVLSSFNWLNARVSNSDVVWNTWVLYPL